MFKRARCHHALTPVHSLPPVWFARTARDIEWETHYISSYGFSCRTPAQWQTSQREEPTTFRLQSGPPAGTAPRGTQAVHALSVSSYKYPHRQNAEDPALLGNFLQQFNQSVRGTVKLLDASHFTPLDPVKMDQYKPTDKVFGEARRVGGCYAEIYFEPQVGIDARAVVRAFFDPSRTRHFCGVAVVPAGEWDATEPILFDALRSIKAE